jgi:hypothetical protein
MGSAWGVGKERLFDYPITGTGKAGFLDLNNDPSHRYAGDEFLLAFEADPAVVREYVPEPLELDGSGLCFLWSGDQYLFTDRQSSEFITPERSHFAESMFWIPCDYEGERYYFMAYSYVNREWLAFLGRGAGVPHKVANVQQTRFHPSDPVYYGPHEGVRVCVTVENIGLVLRAYMDFERTIPPSEMPFPINEEYCPRFLGHRYVYDVASGRPILNDLCAHWGDTWELGEIWTGSAGLTFYDAENEEVLPFQPRRVLGGYWFRLRWGHRGTQPKVIYQFPDEFWA